MSERAMQYGWHTRRFDEMAVLVNDRIDDPSKADVNRYVGLEHLDSDSLTIRRWGSPEDVEATKLRFRVGDIIFGRRRVYQRKLAVADFDGICSAHAMVLRARPHTVVPEFLPFFMQSDLFMERAREISVGSLSPTINWKSLAVEEFALPPLDEQREIIGYLQAFEQAINSSLELAQRAASAYGAQSSAIFARQLGSRTRSYGAEPSAESTWVWKRVDECFDLQLGKMSSKKAREGREQTHYIKNNNVLWDRFILEDLPEMSFSSAERRKFSLRSGDLLVCEGGEIGRAAIWADMGQEIVYQKALHRLRSRNDDVSPRFLLHYLRYCAAAGELEKIATGTTILHLPQERLAALRLPFPDLAVQISLSGQLDAILRAETEAMRRADKLKMLKSIVMKEILAA
jgi:type I restriction enzyme, S subunit